MAANILILGGTGFTGRLIARHLLERTDAIITIASRRIEKAQALLDDIARDKPERMRAVQAVAGDADSLKAVLPGQTIVIVASPTTAHTEMVARHALLYGVDYLDLQLGEKKLATLRELEPEIAKAGRCFITEAGFHPGLPAALVRYAGEQFDRIETANTACYLSIDKDIPYSDAVDELVEVFRNYPTQIFTKGHWTWPGAFQIRKIPFGGDIGTRDSYSMFLEELRPLPDLYPTLQETGFFMAGGHWFTDWIVFPTAIALLKSIPAAHRSIGRFLWWGMRRFQKAPYRTELIVRASGVHAGQQTRFEAAVAHRDAYELTALAVVAALQQYLEGMAMKPGLWMMGYAVDPRRLLTDMKRMGVKVRTATS